MRGVLFNQNDTLIQDFTSNKTQLHAAINPLPAAGNAALWDAVYASIEAMAARTRVSSAIIVCTNGVDNASARTLAECISRANTARVRVYTFGYGSNVQSGVLTTLANGTGARYYYAPNPAQIQSVYGELYYVVENSNHECTIQYTASCKDGAQRKVELRNVQECWKAPKLDTATVYYTAPRDTASFVPLRIGLASQALRGRDSCTLQLNVLDALLPGDALYPSEFTILFDTARAQFKGLATPAGSLLESIPVTVTNIAGGLHFRITKLKRIDSATTSTLLTELRFAAADVTGLDTVFCPLTLSNWTFDRGCFKALPQDGLLAIAPRRPVLTCTVSAPDTLVWLQVKKGYWPDPLSVSVTLRNDGDRDARNVRCRVIYAAADMTLTGTQHDTLYFSPADIAVGMDGSAVWDFSVAPRMTGKLLHLCVEAMCDNAPTLQVCRDVWTPPSGPVLNASASAPQITVDRAVMRYTPMPFVVSVSVKNIGGQATDSVRASITAPPDLQLASTDLGRNSKPLLPGILAPAQQGSVSWLVKHQPTQMEKEYQIGIWVKTANADSAYCEASVIIPPLEGPALAPQCTVPDSLRYDAATTTYLPNPFTVRLSCVNRGGLPAMNSSGFLVLPPDVSLDDASDSLRRVFPVQMNPWKSGDTVPEFAWRLRYTGTKRAPLDLDFRFLMAGNGPTGMPTDTVETRCHTHVQGLPPLFACSMLLPDSLLPNATKSDLLPNPFAVTYRLKNITSDPGTVARVEIHWGAGDGLSADPLTPAVLGSPVLVQGGDTLTVLWLLRAGARSNPRTAALCVRAWDADGTLIECCDSLYIAALEKAMSCAAAASVPQLVFDTVRGGYADSAWIITATLTNSGVSALSALSAEVYLADSTMTRYVEFDPAFSDNSNPKTWPTLFPQASRQFQWGFRLKEENRTLHSVVPEFRIRYTAATLPVLGLGCSAAVDIDFMPIASLTASCSAPARLRYNDTTGQYAPDPFDVKLECVNKGFRSARNTVATLALPPGLMLASPGETITKTFSPALLDHDTGGPAPQLTWSLRSAGFATRDTCLTISFAISGIDTATGGIIHATAFCSICLEGTEPRLYCLIDCLDSLRLNAKSDDVLPNPFPVRYHVTNTGHLPGLLQRAGLNVSGASGLSFDASTPATQILSQVLLPGDTAHVTWLLHVTNLLTPRKADFFATAFDGVGIGHACPCATFIPAVSVINDAAPAPDASGYLLHQNSPNPFSSTTTISYEIPVSGRVRLSVFDALGREVAVLENGLKSLGRHSAVFDAARLHAGMYLCRLEAGGRVVQRLLCLLR